MIEIVTNLLIITYLPVDTYVRYSSHLYVSGIPHIYMWRASLSQLFLSLSRARAVSLLSLFSSLSLAHSLPHCFCIAALTIHGSLRAIGPHFSRRQETPRSSCLMPRQQPDRGHLGSPFTGRWYLLPSSTMKHCYISVNQDLG